MTTISRLMGSGVPASQAQHTVAGKPNLNNTATGTNQATAFAIIHDVLAFSTVASGTGAILPAANAVSLTAQAGDKYFVVNGGANALAVYPPSGGNFAGVAANTAVNVAVGRMGMFVCLGNNVWAANLSA